MGMARRPTITVQDLLFPFGSHQQIACVARDFVNLVRVNEFRAHVKKDWLIIWIECVDNLRLWDRRLNLGSESLNPLPPVQFRNDRNRISPHGTEGQDDDADNNSTARFKRK